MPGSTTPAPELTFLQTDLASMLIQNTPTTVTNFTVSLRNFLNSRHATLNLKQYGTNEQITAAFNKACDRDVQALIEDALFTPALSLLDKSSIFSDHLRSRGNECYKQRQLEDALRCYTLAAAFAPWGSKSSALAYSNRSACFFEQNSLSKSLEDIRMFEETYHTETDNIALKLRERKQKCLEKLNQAQPESTLTSDFCEELFRLKTVNEKIPSAESFVGIKQDEKRGRHVINSGDTAIQPGTLVILESPFSHVLFRAYSFEYKHCTFCLKDLNGSGIPCDKCVFAIYCSPSCKQSQTTHTQTECKISKYLHELKPDRTVLLSLSILLTLPVTSFLSPSPLSILTPSSTTTPSPSSPYPPGFTEQGVYSSKSYSAIENLIYHMEILTQTDIFKYATYALILTKLIYQKTTYFPPTPPSLQESFQSSLLLHQMNLPCNAHSLYKLNLPKTPTPSQIKTSEYEEIGAGAFALLSLINHSCDPNVVRITLKTGKTAVISIKQIKPQQEILDNYGVHFATNYIQTRTPHLESHYNFTCDCPACTQNWPTIEKLVRVPDPTAPELCQICSATLYFNRCQTESHNPQPSMEEALQTYSMAESRLLENNPKDSFALARTSLQTFDGTLQKPHKLVCISQEYMKQALFLLSRTLFR